MTGGMSNIKYERRITENRTARSDKTVALSEAPQKTEHQTTAASANREDAFVRTGVDLHDARIDPSRFGFEVWDVGGLSTEVQGRGRALEDSVRGNTQDRSEDRAKPKVHPAIHGQRWADTFGGARWNRGRDGSPISLGHGADGRPGSFDDFAGGGRGRVSTTFRVNSETDASTVVNKNPWGGTTSASHNKDGSDTTTYFDKSGTPRMETTTASDGTKTTTVNDKDGNPVTTTVQNKDGSSESYVYDADGNKVRVSSTKMPTEEDAPNASDQRPVVVGHVRADKAMPTVFRGGADGDDGRVERLGSGGASPQDSLGVATRIGAADGVKKEANQGPISFEAALRASFHTDPKRG